MARLPEAFLAELRERVDIAALIGERITLKGAGASKTARCPFHDEKSPSFQVHAAKGFYHCFGCGAHGDAIGWLVEYDRMPFREAVEELAARVGMDMPVEVRPAPGNRETPQEAPAADLYRVQQDATRLYRQALRDAPHAVEYLKGRGLSGEVAQRYQVGYAPDGWRNFPAGMDARLLVAAGLMIGTGDGRAYDRFRDRIMFPIRDPRGRVLGFGGRVLGQGEPKYLNSPETPVFSKGRVAYGLYEALQANPKPESLVMVEGNLDVIVLAQHGIQAVATLGTAPSTEHFSLLFRFTRRVLCCFDGDAAGRRAARRALEAALPALRDGRSVAFLALPEGYDPDSLVQEEGAEAFRARLAMAVPGSEYLFQAAAEGMDLGTLEGRAAMSATAKGWIEKLPPGEYRELMRARLAEVAGRRVGRPPRLLAGSWSIYQGIEGN